MLAVCGAMLLAGCSTQSVSREELSDVSIESSSDFESESAAESSSSAAESSSSEAESMPMVVKPKIPRATFNENAISVDSANMTMTVPFTTDIPFEWGGKYYLRIYFNDGTMSSSELRYDEVFDTGRKSLTLKLHDGENQYYIQFYNDKGEGEVSNKISQWFEKPKPVVKHKKFEFYTMNEAVYGEIGKSYFAYPHYDEVDRQLAMGITPDYISVDVYYQCLSCFTKTFRATVDYSYSKGELQPIPNVHCENPRCTYRPEKTGWLFSSIVE